MTLPGTYTLGRASPGSDADRALRARAGYPGVVVRLRYHGVYLPVQLTLARPIPQGIVISQQVDSQWQMTLVPPDGSTKWLLPVLNKAELLKRREDGLMLVEGQEWDDGYLGRWLQTWPIAPTMGQGERALRDMGGWLNARYRGQYSQ